MRKLAVIEPGPLLFSGTPAYTDWVALLSRQRARRAIGVARDVRGHVTTEGGQCSPGLPI
jgi:hypothetical protein